MVYKTTSNLPSSNSSHHTVRIILERLLMTPKSKDSQQALPWGPRLLGVGAKEAPYRAQSLHREGAPVQVLHGRGR